MRIARRALRGVTLAGALLVGSASCLTWDPAKLDNDALLPCDDKRQCSSGFSCLGMWCVCDGCVPMGETCTLDQQCAVGAKCSPRPYFACRAECSSISAYGSTSNCSAGEYCRPYTSTKTSGGVETTTIAGACVASDNCTSDADCKLPNGQPDLTQVCVQIHSSASACMTKCELSFSAGVYRDGCGGNSTSPVAQYCQPLGVPGSQKLVCLDVHDPQQELNRCDPVTRTCASGFACVDTLCKRLCEPRSSDSGQSPWCPAGQTCATKSNDPEYAVCQSG